MTRQERIDRMAYDAERSLADCSSVSISAFNYGLKPGPGLLKSLRAYGFKVRSDGFMGYVKFEREEVEA